jgi:hypothetical protein
MPGAGAYKSTKTNYQKNKHLMLPLLNEISTRYDYNLMIIKSPKPAKDNQFKK